MGFSKDDGSEVYIQLPSGAIKEIFFTNTSLTNTVKLLGSPGEDGVTRTDHKVRQPNVISMRGFVTNDVLDVLSKLEDAMNHMELSKALVHIFLREGDFDKMFVSRLTSRGDAAKLNGVDVEVEFSEFIGVSSK